MPRSERRLRDTRQKPAPKRVEWYVRLKLRQDLLGKLWARNLMPRDVLVWSQDQQHWLRLEEVPRLQTYVAEAVRDWEDRAQVLQAPAQWSSAPPPALAGSGGDARRDVVFRPTGSAARHLASTIPPPSPGAVAPAIPASPRVPSFDEAMESAPRTRAAGVDRIERGSASVAQRRGFAALTQSSVVPPRVARSTIPPPRNAQSAEAGAAPASTAPRAATVAPIAQRAESRLHSSSVDYVERLVWMVAGVATMFAVMAALGKIRRSDLWHESASVGGLVPALGSMLSARLAEVSVLPQRSPSRREPPRRVAEALTVPSVPDPTTESASAAEPDDAESGASRHSGGASAARRFGKASGRRSAEPTDEKLVEEKQAAEKQAAEPSDEPDASKSQAAAAQAPSGLGSFDRVAARRALAGAAARAAKCAKSKAQGTVVVTYASSGLVQNVAVAQLSGANVSAGCVVRTFQSARVTPYFGGSVTVRKTFAVK